LQSSAGKGLAWAEETAQMTANIRKLLVLTILTVPILLTNGCKTLYDDHANKPPQFYRAKNPDDRFLGLVIRLTDEAQSEKSMTSRGEGVRVHAVLRDQPC